VEESLALLCTTLLVDLYVCSATAPDLPWLKCRFGDGETDLRVENLIDDAQEDVGAIWTWVQFARFLARTKQLI
jgi:hypothetical protein